MNREKETTSATSPQSVRAQAANIIESRLKSMGGLQSFYLPVMRQAYQRAKAQNPKLKSPDQLIFNSELFRDKLDKLEHLLSMTQVENRKKQAKIVDQNRVITRLLVRLKSYQPCTDETLTEEQLLQTGRSYEHLQERVKAKDSESSFMNRIKIVASLQALQIDSVSVNRIYQTQQGKLFEQLLSVLTKEIKNGREQAIMTGKQRLQFDQQIQNLQRQLGLKTQMLEVSTQKDYCLRQKIKDITMAWNQTKDQLLQTQNNLQAKQTQLWQLKRIIIQKDSALSSLQIEFRNRSQKEEELSTKYRQDITSLQKQLDSICADLRWTRCQLESHAAQFVSNNEQQQISYRQSFVWKKRFHYSEAGRLDLTEVHRNDQTKMAQEIVKLRGENGGYKVKLTQREDYITQLKGLINVENGNPNKPTYEIPWDGKAGIQTSNNTRESSWSLSNM